MSPTDPISNFNFSATPHHYQGQHHTTTFSLSSLHFPTTAYRYPIIMASPSPQPTKPGSPAPLTSSTGTTDSKTPNCWTDKHEADLKGLAARGEDARSIVELMETDYPCLKGKLSEEWIKEKIKDVSVTG